jgi:ornithine cyclodeaminase
MNPPEFITGDRLRRAVSMGTAVAALEEMFAGPLPLSPQRTILSRGEDQLLSMPAWADGGIGVKLITAAAENPAKGLPLINGVFVLFSADSLEPIALIDAAALTAIRTAAVSALATKYLARNDASHLVVFGAGVQATAHVEAMREVRDIERVTVISRSDDHGRDLATKISSGGLTANPGRPEDVTIADIVCTCTTATSPLFDGALLPQGVHVNAVGTHQPDARELDDTAIGRATVVVETRQAAEAEAGEVAMPIAAGADPDDVISGDLADVVTGRLRRSDPGEITVFKSVGVAFEDLAIGLAAAKALVERLRPR